jgi:hypothetical protein
MVLRMNNITTLTQDIAEVSVSGGILEMWAGELSVRRPARRIARRIEST